MLAKLNRKYDKAETSLLNKGAGLSEYGSSLTAFSQYGMTKFNSRSGGTMLLLWIDSNGAILTIDGILMNELNLQRNDLEGSSIFDTRLSTDKLFSSVSTAIKSGLSQWIFEYEGKTLELNLTSIKSAKNTVNGYMVVVSDITSNNNRWLDNLLQPTYINDLFEHLPVAIVILDESGRVININKEFTNIFQYTLEEVLGKTRNDILVPEELSNEAASMLEKIYSGEIVQLETKRRRKDGSVLDVAIIGNGVTISPDKKGGYLIYTDIAKRKRTEEQILNSLLEKELLLQEVHHRVKNNLQVVSSLLYLQSKTIKDKNVVNMFVECQNRVKSISLIHERLYQTRDISRIDFDQYIKSLVYNLFDSFGVKAGQITFKLRSENIFMGTDTAIPCGLIINELVTNALKYAFPDEQKGEISIEVIYHQDNKFTLCIKDNGVGLPEGYDFLNAETLGSRLVQSLVKQLDGILEIEANHGTEFKIKFSILNYKGGCN